MFERFHPDARAAVVLAQQEAREMLVSEITPGRTVPKRLPPAKIKELSVLQPAKTLIATTEEGAAIGRPVEILERLASGRCHVPGWRRCG